MTEVRLGQYGPGNFQRGRSLAVEAVWVIVSWFLFRLAPFKLSSLKCMVLRAFGAKIGRGVVFKPRVTITFPWKLSIGDDCWIGEEAFLLNLAPIEIQSNVCISQRAFLCTGNHDYKSPTFDLMVEPIIIEQGAWVGACSFVGPGVKVHSHSVLTAGSIATKDLAPYEIHGGNPAKSLKKRMVGHG